MNYHCFLLKDSKPSEAENVIVPNDVNFGDFGIPFWTFKSPDHDMDYTLIPDSQ